MIRYIAFLRAINVSGHNIIKMEELRKLFETMKLKNVRTYIQTGNVIFDTPEKNANVLIKKIKKHLQKSLGYEVETMLRTTSELETIIKNNPFKKTKLDKTIQLYLSFLAEEPTDDLKKTFISLSGDVSTFRIKGANLYTLYQRNKAKDPFSNIFIEKKLKTKATTRNWNVVNKVFELASMAEPK